MTRFLIWLISWLLLVSVVFVLLALGFGRFLREDEIGFTAKDSIDNYAIYLMSFNRNMIRQITYNTYDFEFAWSPDGQSIAATSERNQLFKIYLMDINGQNAVFLNNNPENDGAPAWSPDGHSIVYVSRQLPTKYVLLITNVATKITRSLTHGNDYVSNPTWSPDGKYITFVSQLPDIPGSKLYNMDIANGEINLLTPLPGYYMNAIWSPDNRYLIYAQAQPNPALYIIDNFTGQTRLLYSGNVNIYDKPNWSPNGHYLLFTQLDNDYKGDTSIFQLDLERCLQQISNCIPEQIPLPLGIYASPRWRPHPP